MCFKSIIYHFQQQHQKSLETILISPKGTNYKGVWDKWYGPAGTRTAAGYNANAVVQSTAGQALTRLNLLPAVQDIRRIRLSATIDCLSNQTKETICRPLEKPCLFNINADPCERNNLAEQ